MKTNKPITNFCNQTSLRFGDTNRRKGLVLRCSEHSEIKRKLISKKQETRVLCETGYQSNKCNRSNLLFIMASRMEAYLKFSEAQQSRYLHCDYNTEARKCKIPLPVILRGKKFKDKAPPPSLSSKAAAAATTTRTTARCNKIRTAVIYLTLLTLFLSSLSIINCQISTRSADNQGKC